MRAALMKFLQRVLWQLEKLLSGSSLVPEQASLLNWVLLNAIALSPLVLGAKGNYLAWEKRFEKVVNAPATAT